MALGLNHGQRLQAFNDLPGRERQSRLPHLPFKQACRPTRPPC